MLTRSQARATNQPVFVDDQWNDAYIQAKDEQIDAIHARDVLNGWDHLREEDSEDSDDNEDDSDVWDSQQEESDDEDDEDENGSGTDKDASRWAGGTLAENIFWTTMTILMVPILFYVLLRKPQRWPLQSASALGMLVKLLTNILALLTIAAVAYAAICSDALPESLDELVWRNLELQPVDSCAMSFVSGWRECLAGDAIATLSMITPRCSHALRQLMVLLIAIGPLLCFHRRWLKLLVLLLTTSYLALSIFSEFQAEQRAAVQIYALDPTFAFVNESIFIAIDGQNLEQDGIVAWAPYWGGLQQQKASNVPKLFPQVLHNGGVLVTFPHVNEFVPCYQPHQQSTHSFQCFEAIRLRVKDQKSVPGWSLAGQDKNEL